VSPEFCAYLKHSPELSGIFEAASNNKELLAIFDLFPTTDQLKIKQQFYKNKASPIGGRALVEIDFVQRRRKP
tara:strand:- start:1646 stop:1864 length:219 start_codon:yes stop_codon:yes gene_type:complete